MLPGRTLPRVRHYLNTLENKRNVELVAMDMWRPYRDAVREELPWACIVIDWWHVQKMTNEAMELVRKALRHSLRDAERHALKDGRFVLFKHNSALNPEERLKLSARLRNYAALNSAYTLKENFYGYGSSLPDWLRRRRSSIGRDM